MIKAFGIGGAVLAMVALQSPAARAQSFTGAANSNVEFATAYVFQTTFDESGMSGVSGKVQKCYMQVLAGTITPMRAKICMLLDLTAVSTDRWFRQRLLGESGHMPPATTPILSNAAFKARVDMYVHKYFHGRANEFYRYYPSSSVAMVLNYASALDAR